MDIDAHMRIVEFCLSLRDSANRTDEQGAIEAMYRWQELVDKHSPLPPSTWRRMLYALRRSNRLDHAQAVVADAWNQQAVVDSRFWEAAEALRLTEKVGMVSTVSEEEQLDLELDHMETSMNHALDADDEFEEGREQDQDGKELFDEIS